MLQPSRSYFRNFEFSIFFYRLKFNIVANGKIQNCQYLANGQPYTKRIEIWNSEVVYGVYVQLIFMPKYGNFKNRPVSRQPLPVELNPALFCPHVVLCGYMFNFWHFGQWPSFMPKYGNFENLPISWKPLPVERK